MEKEPLLKGYNVLNGVTAGYGERERGLAKKANPLPRGNETGIRSEITEWLARSHPWFGTELSSEE